MKQATKTQAFLITANIRADFRQTAVSFVRLAEKIQRGIDCQVPQALGLTEREWLASCFPNRSRASLFKALRITRALPEAVAAEMGQENADQLSRLPESNRLDSTWRERARTMSKRDFKEAVDAELGKIAHIASQGPSRAIPGAKPEDAYYTTEWRRLAITLPEPVYRKWEEAIEKVARIMVVDIEEKPGRKIEIYESIAALLNDTDELQLKAAMVGLSAEEEKLAQ